MARTLSFLLGVCFVVLTPGCGGPSIPPPPGPISEAPEKPPCSERKVAGSVTYSDGIVASAVKVSLEHADGLYVQDAFRVETMTDAGGRYTLVIPESVGGSVTRFRVIARCKYKESREDEFWSDDSTAPVVIGLSCGEEKVADFRLGIDSSKHFPEDEWEPHDVPDTR